MRIRSVMEESMLPYRSSHIVLLIPWNRAHKRKDQIVPEGHCSIEPSVGTWVFSKNTNSLWTQASVSSMAQSVLAASMRIFPTRGQPVSSEENSRG